MSFVGLSLLAAGLMGLVCWASNIWPGVETWPRAAVSRLLWWGGPFGLIVWLNGAPVIDSLVLAAAAWLGAWVPHVEFPDIDAHWTSVAGEAAVVLIRVAALMTPPAAVFWLCGAYWPAMLFAAASASPCMWSATSLPHRWPGLADEKQVSGVLFGLATGFWLAVAVWTPTPAPDLLP